MFSKSNLIKVVKYPEIRALPENLFTDTHVKENNYKKVHMNNIPT